jgi:hypothetical protein
MTALFLALVRAIVELTRTGPRLGGGPCRWVA